LATTLADSPRGVVVVPVAVAVAVGVGAGAAAREDSVPVPDLVLASADPRLARVAADALREAPGTDSPHAASRAAAQSAAASSARSDAGARFHAHAEVLSAGVAVLVTAVHILPHRAARLGLSAVRTVPTLRGVRHARPGATLTARAGTPAPAG
jgi:hypothetical protein